MNFAIDEDDVRTFLRKPWVMTASDGDLVPIGQGVPHPRPAVKDGAFTGQRAGRVLRREQR